MSIKIDFNPRDSNLSVKVTATATNEYHGSFLETLRRLVKRAKKINLDLTELEQVDNALLMVMEELRSMPAESTLVLRTKKGTETEQSVKALFDNRQTIVRH